MHAENSKPAFAGNWLLLSVALFATGVMFKLQPALATEVADAEMEREIDYLIDSVADSNCVFIRNGKEHDASDARDHLQMKRKRGRKYYKSTEQFIDRIASKSSWSGKPYRIKCPGDESRTAADWFTQLLVLYRDGAPAAHNPEMRNTESND